MRQYPLERVLMVSRETIKTAAFSPAGLAQPLGTGLFPRLLRKKPLKAAFRGIGHEAVPLGHLFFRKCREWVTFLGKVTVCATLSSFSENPT